MRGRGGPCLGDGAGRRLLGSVGAGRAPTGRSHRDDVQHLVRRHRHPRAPRGRPGHPRGGRRRRRPPGAVRTHTKDREGARVPRLAADAPGLEVPDPGALWLERRLGLPAARARRGGRGCQHPPHVLPLYAVPDREPRVHPRRGPGAGTSYAASPDPRSPLGARAVALGGRADVLHRRLQRALLPRLDPGRGSRALVAVHDALAGLARNGGGRVPRLVPRGVPGPGRRPRLHVDRGLPRPLRVPMGGVRPDRLRLGRRSDRDEREPGDRRVARERRHPDPPLPLRPPGRRLVVHCHVGADAGLGRGRGRERPARPPAPGGSTPRDRATT